MSTCAHPDDCRGFGYPEHKTYIAAAARALLELAGDDDA